MTTRVHDPIQLRIQLPLPTDIAATLIAIVGITYPRTQIADDGHGGLRPRELVLVIDPKDRNRKPKGRKRYDAALKELDADVARVPWLTELDPGGVAVSPHEVLAKSWVAMARGSFQEHPEATNYLETVLRDRDTGQEYVFHVAKGKDRTPHALRREAEQRVAQLEEQVRELTAQLRNQEPK